MSMYPKGITDDFTIQVSPHACLDFTTGQNHFQASCLGFGKRRTAHPAADQHLAVGERGKHFLGVPIAVIVLMLV